MLKRWRFYTVADAEGGPDLSITDFDPEGEWVKAEDALLHIDNRNEDICILVNNNAKLMAVADAAKAFYAAPSWNRDKQWDDLKIALDALGSLE